VVLAAPPPAPADDFFDHGGDSFAVARLATRVVAELGREVPWDLFFDRPTFGRLAALVAAASPGGPETAP
jgi:hypothetical protein